jgi:hypothetical protein
MLEEGQHSAAKVGGVRVNRTNQRAEQIVEGLSKWCLATKEDIFVSGLSAWQIWRMR